MYVLEGLRDYMASMQWQAGDTGELPELLVEKVKWTFIFYFLILGLVYNQIDTADLPFYACN